MPAVTLFGTGYVGLVTSACLAEMGNRVVCVDIDANRIAQLKRGKIPIYEPGLATLIRRHQGNGRLSFTVDPSPALTGDTTLVFITVGTPADQQGNADLHAVLAAASTIGQHLSHYAVVVNKSTVPVGTTDQVRQTIATRLMARDVTVEFDVVSNPEFLKQGDAVNDCLRPDRIIVGSSSTRAIEILRKLYAPFHHNHDRLLVMDERSAELTKYTANAMLATRISFMNEIACVAERLGADVDLVRRGISTDPRIGFHFIYPGVGYGGSCLPKDIRALRFIAHNAGCQTQILNAVETVNNNQKKRLFELIEAHFSGRLEGRIIALWGLSFKPDTDDMRQAPSRILMEALWKAGATVRAYDPVAMPEARRIYGQRDDLVLCQQPYDVMEGADGLAIVTEWKLFRSPDFAAISARLREPVIFDGRNIYAPRLVGEAGLTYYSIGRSHPLSLQC